MVVYIKNVIMQFCYALFHNYCAKLQVSLLNLTWKAIWRDRRELSNNFFCPHIGYMSLQNLESLALVVSEKHYLHMTDSQTDGHGAIGFSRSAVHHTQMPFRTIGLTTAVYSQWTTLGCSPHLLPIAFLQVYNSCLLRPFLAILFPAKFPV